MEKRCPKCEETKSIDNFSKCKSRKDGLKVYCKSCASLDKKKYYIKTKERQKEYRDNNKIKYKEYFSNYYQENGEKIKNNSKDYYSNKDKLEAIRTTSLRAYELLEYGRLNLKNHEKMFGKVVKLDGDCNEDVLSLMGLIEVTKLLK